MKTLLDIAEFSDAGIDQVGGKAYCLGQMNVHGIRMPRTVCVPCDLYEAYIVQTRLKERILLELNRKPIEQMRWEEMWDTTLRIRNFFLTTELPEAIHADLEERIRSFSGNSPTAVRSSAPGEDSSETSFAGLHDSFLNVSGADDIIKHIRLVWASLYSDAALLYRKELGLDIETSRMAVVIQELEPSMRSGIFFGLNPSNAAESIIESVYGLNQALVDGDIEPDRWTLGRKSGRIIDHAEPVRKQYAAPAQTGVSFIELSDAQVQTPPLSPEEIHEIWETGNRLETLFGKPQDVEWTFTSKGLIVLQARPITSSGFKESEDKRAWYLTLHRSYDNLQKLYDKIEHRLIPQMILDADRFNEVDLESLSAKGLVSEIEKRQQTYDGWVKTYWDDFIPFAHGIRLFGQVYNDAVAPEDPYEFMNLLENTGLKSMERNGLIEDLARMIREDAALREMLENDLMPEPEHPFADLLDSFVEQFGDLSCTTGTGSECQYGELAIIQLLLEFADRPAMQQRPERADVEQLKAAYLNSFASDQRTFAADVLFLGRESYRLRDDDNIHLGRIEGCLYEAFQEGQRRINDYAPAEDDLKLLSEIPALSLMSENEKPGKDAQTDKAAKEKWISARQIVGHPAGPGIARGPARLIRNPQDLLSFKQGEILVCQGVDPNMTFVVPLAAGIIEERGGMLIHGAIIAREYGLPCITGAPGAMERIENGSQITVDGYNGIVTCETEEL